MAKLRLHEDSGVFYPETKAQYVSGLASSKRGHPSCEFGAHRGLSATYPENTMPAFIAAVNAGFKLIETDIVQSSDGVQFLLHDATINRTSNGTGTASSMTAAQLLTYDFGYPAKFGNTYAGTQIPTLEEFLIFCKKNGCVAELDIADNSRYNDSMLQTTYNLVKKYNMLDATYFCAQQSRLEALYAIDDTVMISIAGMTSEAAINSAAPLLDSSRLGNFSIPIGDVTQDLVYAAHNNGGAVKVWDTDSTTTARNTFNLGAEIILTNAIIPNNFDWTT